MWRWLVRARPAERDRVRGDERAGDDGEVDEHLDDAPPVHGERLREADRLVRPSGRRSMSARKLANCTSSAKVKTTPTIVQRTLSSTL